MIQLTLEYDLDRDDRGIMKKAESEFTLKPIRMAIGNYFVDVGHSAEARGDASERQRVIADIWSEDAFFGILEHDPENEAARALGVAFYERLRGHSKAALVAGNLPREEVEAGLSELQRRGAPPAPPASRSAC